MARKPRGLPTFTAPTTIAGRSPLVFAVGGVALTAALVALAWKLFTFELTPRSVPPLPVAAADLAPAAPPLPNLSTAPPLPDAAAIAAQAADAEGLLGASTRQLPLWADGSDAFSLAWAAAALGRDQVTPPLLYRHAVGWELRKDHLPGGMAVRFDAEVMAVDQDGSNPWHRALVRCRDRTPVEVLSQAGVPAIGSHVAVTGRFLGLDAWPADHDATIAVPLIAVASLPEIAEESPLEQRLAECAPLAAVPAPEHALWSEIDDQRMTLETLPYYWLLGNVRDQELPITPGNGLPALNYSHDAVARDVAARRGTPFTVTGLVVRAWEDEDVARDHPFGITRVVRVLLYSRDLSPTHFDQRGAEQFGIVPADHLYDLATPSAAALPEVGRTVTARGRLLKSYARPASLQPGVKPRDVRSDHAYSLFVVAKDIAVITNPNHPNLPYFGIGIYVVVTIFGIGLIWYFIRVWRESRVLSAALRAGRQQRADVAARVHDNIPDPTPSHD